MEENISPEIYYVKHFFLIYLISIDNLAANSGYTLVIIDEATMTAKVFGAVLYVSDNNYDNLVDFITIQGFFVGTEPVA